MLPKSLIADFAEVCGIHAGDGWMSSYTNEIGYGTNPKEEQYFQEVLALYKRLFYPSKVRILRRLAIEFRFNSKDAQNIFMSVGFPRGRKLDCLRVPKFIFENTEFMQRFLRGVVDTDGHAYWRDNKYKKYLVLIWVTTSLGFALDIINLLMLLGYHPQLSTIAGTNCDGHKRRKLNRIFLMRKAEIKRFLEEIGFRNQTRWNQVGQNAEDLVRYGFLEPASFLKQKERLLNHGLVV